MTNKATKRALLTSALALLLCVSMLVGTTYAWFTDSVTSTNNKIVAGNLKIDLELLGTNEKGEPVWTSIKKNGDPIFNYKNWEPGYTDMKILKIENEGSLALKWVAKFVSNEALGILADVIDVYVTEDIKTYPTDRADLSDWDKVGTVREFANTIETLWGGDLLAGATKNLGIALKMQETAGNEYQGLNLGAFDIQILATQYTYEDDSFGDDYDEDAPFGTYVELNEGDDLLAAMASAEADMPLTIKLNGNVEWPTDGHHGENDITPASSIVINGNGYTITATGSGVTPLGDDKAPMTLKNVKIVDNSKSYNESAWELSYLEMGGRVLNCVDVDFADPISVDSDKASFTDCTFVGHYDKNSTSTTQYGVWAYNGDSTYTNCTFTGTRGMKICDQYGGEVGTVVVDGCTFNGISEKPGICIDDRDAQDMKITIKNSTFINCKAGDQGEYIYETDNTVPTLENNNVYNNAKFVSTAAEFLALGGKSNEGVIILTADIDLNGAAVPTIGAAYGKELVVLGNGHTISNGTTAHTNHNGMKHHGLFYAYTNSTLTISDLVIDNVDIDATADTERNYGAAIVVAFADGGSNVTLKNVDVKNCDVKNNTPDIGDEAAVYVGYQTGTLTMIDCDSTGCTVAGETAKKTGAFIGMVDGTATLTNCTTDLTIGTCNRVAGTLTEN